LPQVPPGREFLYSNAGYAILGAAAERAAGRPWEDLMRTMLFRPLGMTSAGFGAMGSPGKVDQPWQHRLEGGKAVPVEPGPLSDNPAVIGPGGTVHASMADWARFVLVHLKGARGESTVLPVKDWSPLHEPAFGGDYAGGWSATDRPWGGGRVLTHAGSNTMNYAVVWMAPKRDFAVLAATNVGGDAAAKACDETAAAVIGKFLTRQETPK
ncbi:MAG: beta-lactamase family protein, partial [Planctomycetes bacterium]|nr:beta-lactamase family protein [Planctomycetota bacterium]